MDDQYDSLMHCSRSMVQNIDHLIHNVDTKKINKIEKNFFFSSSLLDE